MKLLVSLSVSWPDSQFCDQIILNIRKTKILYISHSSFFNGAEICLLTLLRNLDRELVEPVVVFPGKGPLIEVLEGLGIKTYITPLERWIRFKYDRPADTGLDSRVHTLIGIIESEQIDLVHTNTSVVMEGAIAAKIKRIPHIWHIHEFLKDNTELYASLPLPVIYYLISLLSDKVISVSNFVSSQFRSAVENNKIVTIYNGVEENHSPQDLSIRHEFGIKDDEILAVALAILTESKGYKNLLEAASEILKKGIKVKFLWAGGSDKKTLRDFEKQVKKLGIKDSFIYAGFRKDIQKLLRNTDILICPSKMETLSLAILEAMAAGKPVITTDCGGPTECVVNDQTGYIVPVDDNLGLSKAILNLCTSKQIRDTFGKNGLDRYKEIFSAGIYAKNIQDSYTGLIDDKTRSEDIESERTLIDSFIQVYQGISDSHWKTLISK